MNRGQFQKVCQDMLTVLEGLSRSPMARIDARQWVDHFRQLLSPKAARRPDLVVRRKKLPKGELAVLRRARLARQRARYVTIEMTAEDALACFRAIEAYHSLPRRRVPRWVGAAWVRMCLKLTRRAWRDLRKNA